MNAAVMAEHTEQLDSGYARENQQSPVWRTAQNVEMDYNIYLVFNPCAAWKSRRRMES